MHPTGSKFNQALVSWTHDTIVNIALVNSNYRELKRYQALGAKPNSADNGASSSLRPLLVVRADQAHDGREKLLAALMTSAGGSPRHFAAMIFRTPRCSGNKTLAAS